MKLTRLLSIAGLILLGAGLAAAETPGGADFTGTYIATLPEIAAHSEQEGVR